jgi:hypothetical protein
VSSQDVSACVIFLTPFIEDGFRRGANRGIVFPGFFVCSWREWHSFKTGRGLRCCRPGP